MSPFGDDFFDEIEKAFFNNSYSRPRTSSSGNVVQSEREERVIDYIEEDNEVYFIFELPGFREKDIHVSLKGNNLNVNVLKKDFSEVKSYLKEKLSQEISFSKNIPVKVDKNFNKNFKNGILEVKFRRK